VVMLRSAPNVFLQKSLSSPWSGLHALRSGFTPVVSLAGAGGSTRLPRHHSGVCDKKSVGHEGASLAMDGVAMSFCRPVSARTKLEVESDQRLWAHSASCMVVMVWISTSWQYILSTPSMMNGGEVLRGMATAASFWPPS
jgi:hypothetical protein